MTPYFVPAGTSNTNTNTSYLVVNAHKVERSCTVSGPPPLPEATVPDTAITLKKVKSKKHKAKITFTGTNDPTGFDCLLKRKKHHHHHKKPKAVFKPCASPITYKHLKPGKDLFEVRATNAVGADPTPAKAKFRIKRKWPGGRSRQGAALDQGPSNRARRDDRGWRTASAPDVGHPDPAPRARGRREISPAGPDVLHEFVEPVVGENSTSRSPRAPSVRAPATSRRPRRPRRSRRRPWSPASAAR